jgi:carbonic anhydrase
MLTRNLLISLIIIFKFIKSQKPDYRSIYTSSLSCEMGRLQSPLNLQEAHSNFNSSVNLLYTDYNPIPKAKLGWSEDGRILQVNEIAGSTQNNFGYIGFDRGGVIKQYSLKKIEINTPAEHQIEGISYDIEIKLIHEKMLPFETNVNQFRRIPDGNKYLIISLLYSKDSGSSDNGLLKYLVSSWSGNNDPFYYDKFFNLDLNSFDLVRDRRWFFYEGSFTSFPCDETVNYIVIRDPFLTDDLEPIKNIYLEKYNSAIISKPINEDFGRPIYRNFMNATEILTGGFIKANFMYLLVFIFISLLI